MSETAARVPSGDGARVPEPPLLARLSVAMFGMVMGIGGLANAWALAHRVFGAPVLVSELLLGLAVLLFGVLAITHLLKLSLHFSAVREEFAHPVRSSFFPTISVAAVVLSIGLRPYAHGVAEGLWWFGAMLHFVLAVTLIRRWILHAQDEGVLTPAWFIPVVGNILIPIGGVPLGHVEISWFFFSVGLILWLAFFTIVLHRVLFVPAMSQRSMPTLLLPGAPEPLHRGHRALRAGGRHGCRPVDRRAHRAAPGERGGVPRGLSLHGPSSIRPSGDSRSCALFTSSAARAAAGRTPAPRPARPWRSAAGVRRGCGRHRLRPASRR
ncbi:MAG: hypothetical protein EOP79_20540 [Variovorax sp.]|nr:MAG: hypothetical protein EOP79_20540 [Variovorax sp.]